VYRVFKFKGLPVITSWVAEELVRVADGGGGVTEVTLDLGLSKSEVLVKGGSVVIGGYEVSIDEVKGVVGDDAVYVVTDSGLVPLKFYDEGLRRYYKLRALGPNVAPTLEINGIHMHRIEGTDPWSDSLSKVRSLGRLRGGRVLDVCTGLGYTASLAIKYGASEVVTIEVDDNVLKIAEYNPWSKGLEEAKIILGDATEVIHSLSNSSFTHVIHDPPRFEVAGELYSLEFYRELLRVLRPRGKLFHYVGRPRWRRGVGIVKGVKERLVRAGFVVVKWVEEAQGFLAIKPS